MLRFILSFRPDAQIEHKPQLSGTHVVLRTQYGGFDLTSLCRHFPDLLEKLAAERFETGSTKEELQAWIEKRYAQGAVFLEGLQLLTAQAFISTHLEANGQLLAALHPLGAEAHDMPQRFMGNTRVQLSRFALLRTKNQRCILECPKGLTQIDIYAEQVAILLFHLAQAHSPAELAEHTGLSEEATRGVLALLDAACALCPVDSEGIANEDRDPVFRQWEVHDLYFHTRSRSGRHADGRVQPFRFRETLAPLPICKADMRGKRIVLPRPDLRHLENAGRQPAFFDVFEQRLSRRTFGKTPPTLEELGAFLFFSARVKHVHHDALGGYSFRPSPSGGALHALELYPLVNSCQGLEQGLYQYNPEQHHLVQIAPFSAHPEIFEALISQTKQSAACPFPHINIIHTARFQREQYKYASIAYALILKDMGCLHQSMYLVAEALGLAGVALGGGGTELFARLTGLDYFCESPLGSFLLGSRAPAKA